MLDHSETKPIYVQTKIKMLCTLGFCIPWCGQILNRMALSISQWLLYPQRTAFYTSIPITE